MNECPVTSNIDFQELIDNIANQYCDNSQNYPWIVGYSGGKDSTLVVHLVFNAILNVNPKKRLRTVYIVSNNTLIENPLVLSHIKKQIDMMDSAAKAFSLPIKTIITTPDISETFWVLLIGKGYPTPKLNLRWCTDRLKIKPTSNFIRKNIDKHGSSIIVLGVRKDESSNRKKIIEKYENLKNSELTPHSSLKNAFIYRPISELTTNDVWFFLAHEDPLWGGTHEELIELYKEAENGECPLILHEKESSACAGGRMGCWCCTLVNKDRSLKGFIDYGNKNLIELYNFRNWLLSIRDNPEYRQVRRRTGQSMYKNGKLIYGPFTIEARKLILKKLLEMEKIYGEKLISDKEIKIIKEIWVNDICCYVNQTGV